MPKNNETAVLSIIMRVQHCNVEKYRDKVEALECQKQTLPMSAVSAVQTSGMHDGVRGRVWWTKERKIPAWSILEVYQLEKGSSYPWSLELPVAPKWQILAAFFTLHTTLWPVSHKETPAEKHKPGESESIQSGCVNTLNVYSEPTITTNAECPQSDQIPQKWLSLCYVIMTTDYSENGGCIEPIHCKFLLREG